MAPKGQAAKGGKGGNAAAAKAAEKTFGMKNKGKSKAVQQIMKQAQGGSAVRTAAPSHHARSCELYNARCACLCAASCRARQEEGARCTRSSGSAAPSRCLVSSTSRVTGGACNAAPSHATSAARRASQAELAKDAQAKALDALLFQEAVKKPKKREGAPDGIRTVHTSGAAQHKTPRCWRF